MDLPEPDKNTRSRREQRVEQEERKFDEDHYLADYFDDSETIESQVLAYEPAYKSAEASDLEYSESEVQVLKELPRKRFYFYFLLSTFLSKFVNLFLIYIRNHFLLFFCVTFYFLFSFLSTINCAILIYHKQNNLK